MSILDDYPEECGRVAKLIIATEKQLPPWKWSDADTFWIDVQMFVKYGLSDDEIIFCVSHQSGIEQYKRHKPERVLFNRLVKEKSKDLPKGELLSEKEINQLWIENATEIYRLLAEREEV